MNRIERHLETVHGLPEDIRKFLAGGLVFISAIGLFFAWRYGASVQLVQLSSESPPTASRYVPANTQEVAVFTDRTGGTTGTQGPAGNSGRNARAAGAATRVPGMFDWVISGMRLVGAGIADAANGFFRFLGSLIGWGPQEPTAESGMGAFAEESRGFLHSALGSIGFVGDSVTDGALAFARWMQGLVSRVKL